MRTEKVSDPFREAYARELSRVKPREPGIAEYARALEPERRRLPVAGLVPAWLGAAAALAVAISSLATPAMGRASLSSVIARSWPADAGNRIATFAASAGGAFNAGPSRAPRSSP
ncbi:MAG: hypothetical protein JXA15_02995 [Spirochaetales bacterium]|nr:hypothetical protein [Spirochaetales bacterium]